MSPVAVLFLTQKQNYIFFFCPQELVREFNFHRYDNLKHAANKRDPRRHKYETKGLSIVNLLFSAASGDLAALRRYGFYIVMVFFMFVCG